MRPVATLVRGLERPPLLEFMGPKCDAWALSTYARCEFRCVYCVTGVQGASTPKLPTDVLVERLRAELHHRPDVRIAVGALCDAYPDVEQRLGVTRAAIEVLVEEERTFGITTKGTTVLRDADLLRAGGRASVTVSLCSTDDAVLRQLDPRAPRVAERLGVVQELAAQGIDVKVSVAPWIPGVTDAEALLDAVGDAAQVWFTVLNVHDPHVASTRFGRRFDQARLNAAFERERDRIGPRPGVFWFDPDPLDPACPARTPVTHPPRPS